MDRTGRRRAKSPVRSAWFWRSVGLHVGAVLGVVSLVAVGLCAGLGIKPIAFGSDAMAPAYGRGDLALARYAGAEDIGVGDVVRVQTRSGDRVTHRVEQVEPFGDSIRLTLKADASEVPDPGTYEVTGAEQVWTSVPWLGYLVGPLHGLLAMVCGGIFMACLAVVLFTPHRRVRGARRSG